MKCIIIDDEPKAHEILKNYISRLDYVDYCGSFFNAIDAIHYLRKNKVDVILLDINMPVIDGFSLLEMLENKHQVIFTTAYQEFAARSYDVSATDYLLKPIRFERFVQSIEKVNKQIHNINDNELNQNIELRIDGIFHKITTTEILFFESIGNYVKIICKNKTQVAHATLKEIESKLSSKQFIRIHKSYIVNKAYSKIGKEDTISIDKYQLPIGKTYKKYTYELL